MPMVPDDRALSHPPDARLLGNDSEGCRECGYGTVSRPSGEPGLGDSRAEPLLRGRLLGKGRLLEPKSLSRQNARLRAGIKMPRPHRERDRMAPVSRSTAPRQFPLHPYTSYVQTTTLIEPEKQRHNACCFRARYPLSIIPVTDSPSSLVPM